MRRRLIVTIVGAVAAALVLAGLGTLVLAGVGARRHAESELRHQVETVTESLSTDDPLIGPGADRPRLLAALRGALRLEGVGLLTLPATGPPRGEPPEGITLSEEEVEAVRAGDTVSGRDGRLVFAAATMERGGTRTIVLLSDNIGIALGGSVLWFLLAGTAVLVLAVVVATRLAGALTGPLSRAEDASRRIAGGDLTARVPEPPDGAADEVATLSRSINAMAGALERSRGLEQQFLLSVSHDLRTPLTSIRGYAEALADGTAADAAQAGTVIISESRRLDRLVRDLLELARLDARLFSLEPEVVELHELVEACAEGFAPEAAAAGIAIEVRAGPTLVDGDPDRLAQVVANLLENALKFATRRVVVTLTTGGGRSRVLVEDDGPGIDPDDRDHVFERLYVARHHPARRESGSGLGLAIVRELVGAMGGTVGVEAGQEGGAGLWFDLPARRQETSQNPNTAVTDPSPG
jgi:two-component system sensor histidine kinase BaeS